MEKALKIHRKVKIYYDEEVLWFTVDYKWRRVWKYKFQLTDEISEKVKKFIENKPEKNFESLLSDKEFVSKHLEKRNKQKKKNIYYCLCWPCWTILKKINNKIFLISGWKKSRTLWVVLKKSEIEEIFLK